MSVLTRGRPSPEELEELRQEHIQAAKELPPRVRQSPYLNSDCIECHKPRFRLDSRYCRRCHAYFAQKEAADIASGKNLQPNYGYSESGFNVGLNAWVWDREHYRKLERLARLEGVFNSA